MADIQYPSTLPDFRMGKRRTQQQTYRTSQPFAGPLFIEKITDESPVSWEVSILCIGQIQARQFQAFLRAVNNGQPFDKKILTEEGAIDHEVRFVDMPLQPTQLSDVIWEYSGLIYAVALVQPDDVVDDLLIANWLQDASIIDNAVNNLWGFGAQPEPVVFNPILWMPLLSNLDVAIGTGPATFVNASGNRSYVDRLDGLIKYAAANEARFESEGELSEGASTNLLLRSEEFDNASWVKFNATVSANAVISPDGSLTADKLEEDAANSAHRVEQIATVSNGATVTISVIAKQAERSVLTLNEGFSGFIATFDLTTGNISGANAANATSESMGDGWFLCTLTSVVPATSSIMRVYINLTTASQGVAGEGIYIWGAQLEAIPLSSSYIPTTTIAVTRAADDLSIPTAGNFNEVEGAISINACVIGDLGSDQYLLEVSDGTNQNIIAVLRSNDKLRLIIFNGGATQVNISTTFDMVPGTQYKIAVNYKDNDVELFVDGVSIGVDVSVTIPTNLTVINSGKSVAGEQLFGHINQLKFFDRNLTPAEIADL